MVYEPNFIINDQAFLLKRIEEVLFLIPNQPLLSQTVDNGFNNEIEGCFDLMSVNSLSEEDLKELLQYFQDFGDFINFKNTFRIRLSNPLKVQIDGHFQIKIINYLLYFFICFFEHKDALLRIYEKEIFTDEFGIKNKTNWEKKFKSLFENVIIKESMLTQATHKVFYKKNTTYNIFFENICNFFLHLSERVFKLDSKEINRQKDEYFHTGFQKGITFENECSLILIDNGWKTEFTKKTGDQGADIIAHKGKMKLVVQCKFYDKPVGNDAVQQIISARLFYDATVAAVVSKSGFTKPAEQLAEKTSVLLLSTSDLNDI